MSVNLVPPTMVVVTLETVVDCIEWTNANVLPDKHLIT